MGCTTSALALDVAQFFPSLHCDVIIFMLNKFGFAPELHITTCVLPIIFGTSFVAKIMIPIMA